MPKRAVHGAEPSKHPQPRRMGVVLWLLLALSVALTGVAVALSISPAAMGAVLSLITLGALCFELAGWLARRR
jgi:hypothetical protein